jgi:osmotically-inducible protein OsmY
MTGDDPKKGTREGTTVTADIIADEVEEKIRQALHRDAEMDAERIHVGVDGGKVTLRGRVRTSAEIATAESAARAARGVTEVESHLRSEDELDSY